MTRIVYRISIRVGVVGFQSYINTDLLSSGVMLYDTICLDTELYIIAISTMHYPYSFDLLSRKVCNLLLRIANQPQASNATPIGEGDVLPIRRELPSRCFVLD